MARKRKNWTFLECPVCEFSENGFGCKKKLFSRPLDLETVLPPIWGGSPSNLGRFEKVDFSLVFLSDLSHCISLGHLYLVWFPNPLAAGSQMGTLSSLCVTVCRRSSILLCQLQIPFSPVVVSSRTQESHLPTALGFCISYFGLVHFA